MTAANKPARFDLWAVDDEGFDPYQHRIFCHIARVGICFQAVRTIADVCSISVGKVSETRNWLLENGYIEWAIDPKTGKRGVRIIEFWCSSDEQRSPDEQINKESSPHEQLVHDMNADVHSMNNDVHHMNLSNTNLKQQLKENKGKEVNPPTPRPGYADLIWNGILEFFENDESKARQVIGAQAAFSDITGIKQPYVNGNSGTYREAERNWWEPLGRMMTDCDNDLGTFRDCITQVMAIADAPDGFTVASPRSTVKTFGGVLAKRSRVVDTVVTVAGDETPAQRIARLFPNEVNNEMA